MSDSSLIHIGLCDPKSPTNVGAILRAAGCYQADAIRYTGTRYARANQYNTDTKRRDSEIELVHSEALLESLPSQMEVVSIELVEGAIPLPSFKHPRRAIYIFGPEDGSVPQDIILRSDHVVYIPTIGCMNLAATVNVVLYDRLAKSEEKLASDELQVSRNRDNNNRLYLKP